MKQIVLFGGIWLAVLLGLPATGCKKSDGNNPGGSQQTEPDVSKGQPGRVICIDWQRPQAWAEGRRENSPSIKIQARINEGPWLKERAVYPLKGDKVRLKVDESPKGVIRWYQISADLSKIYKNANHPWEKDPYKWVGFGKIEYLRRELTQFRGLRQVELLGSQEPTFSLGGLQNDSKWKYYHDDVGSFWLQVEIEQDGQIYRSAGIEDSDHRGISPEVFRVSIRDGADYVGYLTSFFNVPGLFGSVNYQSENHIGVDCADVIATAYRKSEGKPVDRNYNVAMLVSEWPRVAQFQVKNGLPSEQVKWGSEVRRGDVIAVRYAAGRQYQHVGALAADANENGLLDGGDRVIHAGPTPLHYSYLKEGNFDGQVVILRP